MTRSLSLSVVAMGLLVSSGAWSQQPYAPTATAALQTLDPTPGADRFFAVPDGEVHGFADLHFGLVATYAHRPLRDQAASTDFIDGQVLWYGDATLDLARRLMLNLSLPGVVNAAEADSVEHGLGDLRLSVRGHLVHDQAELANLGLQLDTWLPTGNPDAWAGDTYVRFQPRLLLSGSTGHWAYAASAGYLIRKDEDLGASIVGDSVSYGVAMALRLARDTVHIGPECYGLVPVEQEGSASPLHAAALEALLGVKLRLGHFVLGGAGGMGLTKAAGVAEARGLLSVAYARDLRVLDRDGDLLDDADDRCPAEPARTEDGCPEPDGDGDSVVNADDACPEQPGLVHVDPRQHGCPPEHDMDLKPW